MELDSRAAAKSDRLGAVVGAEFTLGHLSALGAEAIPLLGRRGRAAARRSYGRISPRPELGHRSRDSGTGGLPGRAAGGRRGMPRGRRTGSLAIWAPSLQAPPALQCGVEGHDLREDIEIALLQRPRPPRRWRKRSPSGRDGPIKGVPPADFRGWSSYWKTVYGPPAPGADPERLPHPRRH